MPSSSQPPHQPALTHARQLLAEGREADAAAWLEAHPSPHADALHRQIATRAATTALQARDIATATAWLDRGLARTPADATLNFFRGNLHQDSGHTAAAIACYRHCVAAQPQREEFVSNLGHSLVVAGRHAEAVALLDTLPGSASAQLNLGAALMGLGKPHPAATAFESAARLKPDLFAAWLNLGNARGRLDDYPAALSAYNRAVALNPTSVRAHLERGITQERMKHSADAAVSFQRSLSLDPTNLDARFALARCHLDLCDWSDVPTLRHAVVEPVLAHANSEHFPLPFSLLTLPGSVTQQELRRIAELRSASLVRQARPLRATAPIPHGRPLRIGYVSPDFGNHAVGNCLRTLLARHDRSRVSIHVFSLVNHGTSEFRATLQSGCETWDDLDALADLPAAERIASRGIDVLVDLAGHTKATRLSLFAWRPAPVQITWLGYPGTTGAPFIDHLFADEYLIPPSEESAFSEHLVRLPGSYLPTDDAHEIAPGGADRAANALPAAGFVFCAFNNAYKIEPLVFGAWMEILRRTPGSILWLRSAGPVIEANLRREAAARGVDAGRLVFDPRSLPRAEHLARHRAAQLYLDTHFYNAHSTAADALRAGLPVLTFPGQSFPSRVGLSLLSTLGLADELVATSLEDYVQRAVRLAAEPDRLAALHARLAQAIAQPGGLFDTAAFARKLETAYERLCGRRP